MLEQIIDTLQTVDNIYIYLLLFGIAFLENVFPPIPGDVPIVFAGSLVMSLDLSAPLCIAWASVGSVLGFMVMYFLGKNAADIITGKTNANTKFGKWISKIFSKDNLVNANTSFRRYGYGLVLLNRFLPGSRSVISIAAGMSSLQPIYILISAGVSAVLWNVLLVYLGVVFGAAWKSVASELQYYGILLTFAIIGIGGTWFLFSRLKRNRRKKKAAK